MYRWESMADRDSVIIIRLGGVRYGDSNVCDCEQINFCIKREFSVWIRVF